MADEPFVTVVSLRKIQRMTLDDAKTVREAMALFSECSVQETDTILGDTFARLNGVDVTESPDTALQAGDFLSLYSHELAHFGIQGRAGVAYLNGIKVEMFANDHPPPHFHVQAGGQRARIAVRDLQVLSNSLPSKTLARVIDWASDSKDQLLANWELARKGWPFERIVTSE